VGTRFRGLEQLRRRLTGGAPLLASTSSEPLSGTLWIASFGHFGLTGGTLDAPAYCAGLCPPDAMSGTVVLAAPDGGHINGAPLEEGGLLLFPPGGFYEGWSPRGYRWISAFFPKSETRRLVRAADVPPGRLSAASVRQARLRADDLAALRAQVDDLEFERPRAAPAPLPERAAHELAARWKRILMHGWTRGVPVAAVAARRRGEELLRAADRYLRGHLAQPVYVADLVRATGSPERTLEHAFRRRLGLTPMAYLTWLRMAAARRRLTDRRRSSSATVTEAAHGVGFPHLGRFAAAYRRTFGEAPQATLLAHSGRRRRGRTPAFEMGPTFDPTIVAPALAAR